MGTEIENKVHIRQMIKSLLQNMVNRHNILFLFLLLATVRLSGQNLSFYIDPVLAPADGQVIVPVKCTGFEGILGLQFSINWDTSHLVFDTVSGFGLPLLSSSNFGTIQTGGGALSVLWSGDPLVGGESLSDSTAIFEITFQVAEGCSNISTIEFADIPVEQLVIRLDGTTLTEVSTEYLGTNAISFCPLLPNNTIFEAPICEGDTTGSIDISPAGGIPPYQISWSNGREGASIVNLAAGTYTYTITDGIGNIFIDSVLLADGPPLSISIGDDIVSCDDFFDLSAMASDNFSSYEWYIGENLFATTTTPTLGVTSSGTYSVLAVNARGCTASDTMEIFFPQAFEARLSSSKNTICTGDTISLQATGAENIEWISGLEFLSSIEIPNPLAYPDLPTEFIVVLSNECFMDTASLFIDLSVPTATTSPDTCVTKGVHLQLNASGGIQYFWSGQSIETGTDSLPDPMVSPTESTTYFVTVFDEFGCTATDSVRVEVVENPLLNIPKVNLISPNGDGKN
ncbi:MAG TPA: hypothetical protein ENJ95_06930, partial [Bacteroidetes bacterium]|nr:hypothetical protein [Bacteroidota bacterium]